MPNWQRHDCVRVIKQAATCQQNSRGFTVFECFECYGITLDWGSLVPNLSTSSNEANHLAWTELWWDAKRCRCRLFSSSHYHDESEAEKSRSVPYHSKAVTSCRVVCKTLLLFRIMMIIESANRRLSALNSRVTTNDQRLMNSELGRSMASICANQLWWCAKIISIHKSEPGRCQGEALQMSMHLGRWVCHSLACSVLHKLSQAKQTPATDSN